ncbi:uncharacterized protein PHACADRAFT_133752 [Phanerochaete carnosa HHB-10118-sp]|uniref:Nucleolar 27S pre-rRNA processing Urb2/Npa2 C-terminal domain-containing protein n=1 Tax=Phanerochaete carnosa (strain HHB-10118-sp) TaxID=650164 RepID=K5WAD2_PHACS|nr:uncharacterized protein PHACADRAFT_133752 [Phanerochaete carnosa HHB-10118-sp]EKM60878.1 hypothetical protein PHACADRAFT_133752 [Phanerochaete carnosa HHB-10118-sp]
MSVSPQDFIRALRAPADPPHPGGPEKVQIACDVWNSPALYVPNKGEAIAEFLLSRLLKDKDKLPGTNPLFDARYWSLLRDILVGSDVAKSRSAKAWLVPILQRTPLVPIANTVLTSWMYHTAAVLAQVLPAAECLSILWPLAVPKFSPEALLECFGTVIRLLDDYSSFFQALDPSARTRAEHVLTQIVDSYRYSATNASNKKKNGLPPAFLCSDVYEAGVETMFNVDVLRQAQDRDDYPYVEFLSSAITASPVAACHGLPRLFKAFIQVTRRHKAAIFGQSSHQAPGASADQARQASLKFFAMCDSLLSPVNEDEIRWETKTKLLRIMNSEGLYGANNESIDKVLSRIGEETIAGLANFILVDGFTLGLRRRLTAVRRGCTVLLVCRLIQWGAYRLLLYIPAEYLSRGIRSDLLRRALAADVLSDHGDAQTALFVREFLRRLFMFMGSAEHSLVGPYLTFLLRRGLQDTSSQAFIATSELVRMHLVVCIKSSLKGEHSLPNDAMGHFETFVSGQPSFVYQELAWNGVLHFVDTIVTEGKQEEYGSSVLSRLRPLHQSMSSLLLPLVKQASLKGLQVTAIAEQTLLLNLWHRSLVLQRWVSPGSTLPAFGKALTTKLLFQLQTADAPWSRLYLATLSIVAEECRSAPQQTEYLEVVMASYLAFYKECNEQVRHDLDELLSKFFKSLSSASFSAALDLVYDGLSQPGLKPEDVANLVHVLALLLQNAPEGSSKIMQASLTRCLQLFAAKQEFVQNGVVHTEALRFIARQFNDRPALVRQLDLSSVWSILGQSLEGSVEHGRSTNKPVFHEVISIVSALIRLRRDLVISTLPHLAFVLRRLHMSLRHVRPQLGAKQSKMVTDTLPRWVNTHDPLSSEEARALARLLTTMTTKTVVRGQQHTADGAKAESLARPFAKHAAYVLQAHIEALNDPLCVVPGDVRRELEPGLFALCDMMGEYSRDALMVSALDAGGKAVLKNIWREYEKQKYVGKG